VLHLHLFKRSGTKFSRSVLFFCSFVPEAFEQGLAVWFPFRRAPFSQAASGFAFYSDHHATESRLYYCSHALGLGRHVFQRSKLWRTSKFSNFVLSMSALFVVWLVYAPQTFLAMLYSSFYLLWTKREWMV